MRAILSFLSEGFQILAGLVATPCAMILGVLWLLEDVSVARGFAYAAFIAISCEVGVVRFAVSRIEKKQ